MGIPPRFQAVAESLAAGRDATEACAVLGQALAQDGVDLGECLQGLRRTSLAVSDAPPSYEHCEALAVAWSESTLGYLHQLSCEEPLTGLATLAHVRSRLSELYRNAEARHGAPIPTGYALVVVEPWRPSVDGPGVTGNTWSRAMRLAALGQTARTVFPGTETIGRLGLHRMVVIARREGSLGRRVSLLRRLIMLDDPSGARVWIEGLPNSDQVAAQLLDELARC